MIARPTPLMLPTLASIWLTILLNFPAGQLSSHATKYLPDQHWGRGDCPGEARLNLSTARAIEGKREQEMGNTTL